jgi:hypothetical protein
MINFVGSALAIVLCLLSMPAPMVQAATHQTVPSANFSFMPSLCALAAVHRGVHVSSHIYCRWSYPP